MTSNISGDFTIKDIEAVKGQNLTETVNFADSGGMNAQRYVAFRAQTNEYCIFDKLYTAGSSASPWSFFSGGQDLPFSVSFWIYPYGNPSATANIVGKYGTGSAKREWMMFMAASGTRINFILLDESTNGAIGKYTSAGLSTSNWHHVVGTYDGGEESSDVKIYVNGSAVTIAHAGLETGTYNGMDTSAGGYFGSIGSANLNSALSDVSIWNSELSAAQVTSLYNGGTPTNLLKEDFCRNNKDNLVCWWRMGNHKKDAIKDGGGSSAVTEDNRMFDASGNDRHGLPYTGFDGDEIGTTNSLGKTRNKVDDGQGKEVPEFVPFSRSVKGVANLRGRNSAYTPSLGGNPSEIAKS